MFGRVGLSGEVLTELRAIRQEIHDLADKVSNAATRDDLDDYVTKAEYQADRAGEARREQDWRYWAPFAFTIVWSIAGRFIHLG